MAWCRQVADARCANNLRQRCFEFILRNFGKVIGTASFTELPQHLLQEVLKTASQKGVYLRH